MTHSLGSREHALAVIDQVLDEMGVDSPSTAGLLLVESTGGSSAVLRTAGQFVDFMTRFCLHVGCIPYTIDSVGGLSVGEFADRYLQDSYPATPRTPLDNDSPALRDPADAEQRRFVDECESRVCFVLGVGRSGTTLFQAMLNRHPALWAPGELHLALFDTMRQRAERVPHPFLRHAFAPEAADRLAEEPAAFAARLETWEQQHTPTVDVYRTLAEADTDTIVVDKTPTYARRRSDLDWILHHFPAARFVHLVRHPLEVAGSFVRMQLHRQSTDPAEQSLDPHHLAEATWFRHNENIFGFLASLPADRWCRVRFEDLVKDPGVELAAVCNLLGIEYAAHMADPYAHRSGPVTRGAGDPGVNRRQRIEQPDRTAVQFPLSARTRRLASQFGYAVTGP